MYLIAGLGNPGIEYRSNRHNAGFMVIDSFLENKNYNMQHSKFQGLMCKNDIHGEKVFFLKPMTYMNLSGNSICALARYYHIKIKETLIIHDDVDLPLGKIKLKLGGGAGGHNGLKSIIENFSGDKNFYRLRLGVGPKDNKILSDFVLSDFPVSQSEELRFMISNSVKAIEYFLRLGPVKAMNRINGSAGQEK
jgi:PTH1 family peptidyl-tRNA hydrolase